MGIDDRDYMRDRYRKRQGLDPGATQWNDRKARVELNRFGFRKSVPLGSASWISGGSKGSWFEARNRGHDYQRGRWRTRPRFTPAPYWQALGVGVAIALVLAAWAGQGQIKRATSSLFASIVGTNTGFPESGTVAVSSSVDLRTVRSHLTIQGGADNSIVQLLDPATAKNRLSVYVRAFERVTVPAPLGQYRVRFIHGREWADSRTFFGKGTLHDEVAGVMLFTRRVGHTLDLRLGADSNLVVRRIAAKPASIQ